MSLAACHMYNGKHDWHSGPPAYISEHSGPPAYISEHSGPPAYISEHSGPPAYISEQGTSQAGGGSNTDLQ